NLFPTRRSSDLGRTEDSFRGCLGSSAEIEHRADRSSLCRGSLQREGERARPPIHVATRRGGCPVIVGIVEQARILLMSGHQGAILGSQHTRGRRGDPSPSTLSIEVPPWRPSESSNGVVCVF